MRHTAFRILCFTSLVFSQAWADTPAPISDVVLYPGSATVIRIVKVAPGNAAIAVARLPSTFDARTLRVEASTGIRVGETVIRDVARTEAFSPQEADLEAKIQALQDQQAELDAQAKAAEIVKDYLGRVGGMSMANGLQVAPDAKGITTQAEAIGRAAGEALSKVQRLAVQKRELEKKVVALQADLGKLRTGDMNTREVSISVAADKAGTLKLSYQIANAGWRPAYRAELVSSTGKVELERLAVISQKTGEDWSNVRLVLSTTQPRNSPAGPEPQPWLLRYYPPQVNAGAIAMQYAAAPPPAPAPAVAGTRSRIEEPEYRPPTFETQSTFATEFEVPARSNIASDGQEVSLQLNKYQLPIKQWVRAAPRISTAAYVVAEGDRPQGVWPAGMVQLFRDGNFVGSGQWNLADKERFTLYFGRDDLVRVATNAVKQDAGTTGVFDKKNERRQSDVFTIASAHQGPVDVQVLESAPVAISDEIKVRATFDPKPTVENWNNLRGVVAWEKSIKPNEAAKFSVDYVIEFPKEGAVSGLR